MKIRGWIAHPQERLWLTLHYRNRGQIFKIGVNFFKNRQGQKMPSAQDRHFLPLPL